MSGLKVGFFSSAELICFTCLLRLPNLPEEAQESIEINKNNFCLDVMKVQSNPVTTKSVYATPRP